MTRKPRSPLPPLLLGALLWAAGAAGAVAAEPSPAPAAAAANPAAAQAAGPAELRYRRVFAPHDDLSRWPLSPGRYLPINAAEFERLLTSATAAAPNRAAITSAVYEAQWSPPATLTGHATLEVALLGPGPVLLRLEPLNLTVTAAAWQNQPQQTVHWGALPDGPLAVVVERGGRLELTWSLRGQLDSGGNYAYHFQWPATASNRLRLNLPEKMRLIARDVIARDSIARDSIARDSIARDSIARDSIARDSIARDSIARDSIASSATPAGGPWRRWELETGGRARLDLVAAGDATLPPAAQLLLRQATTYECSVRGLSLSSVWTIDVGQQPLEKLRIKLDRPLRLISARGGGRALSWSDVASRDNQPACVELHMPEPLVGPGQTIRLSAIAPLVTGQPWTLPRLWSDDASWEQGSLALLAVAPLGVEQLLPQGCRQSAFDVLSGARAGDGYQFECFTADAALGLVLARRPARLEIASGTAIELGSTGLKSQVLADVKALDGEAFALSGDLGPQWTIDTVETTPDDALDDWSVESSGGRRRLKVSLAKGIAPSHGLRIRVAARKPFSPLRRKLALDELVPLRLTGSDGPRRLVALATGTPYELQISDADTLHRVEPRSLEAAQLRLFAERPRGTVFFDDRAAAGLKVTLLPRKPAFAATIRLEATVTMHALQERYRLACVPDATRLDHVIVHFAHRRQAPLRWTVVGEDDQPLAAVPLAPEEQRAVGLGLEDEAWKVILRPPRRTPFELEGKRSVDLVGQQPISLAAAPEAASQRATVVVRTFANRDVQIQNSRLRPAPGDTAPAGRGFLRAAFVYDPARDVAAGMEPAISVVLAEPGARAIAWVTRAELESRYQADGQAEHWALYQIQGNGCTRIHLTLPADVDSSQVQGVWVNRQPAAWTKVADGPDRLAVDLPPGDKAPAVGLDFTTAGSRLSVLQSLAPPLVQVDLPILDQHWTVWLPPGFTGTGPNPNALTYASPPASWTQRLFGPLGQTGSYRTWNPLSLDAWLPLQVPRDVQQAARSQAEQLLAALGTAGEAAAGRPENDPFTWGALLGSASLRPLNVNLLLDEPALARAEIAPATPFLAETGLTGRGLAAAAFQQAHLALVLHPDALLLTTRTGAALLHDHVRPTDSPLFWMAVPGTYFDQLREAALGGQVQGIVPVDTWLGGDRHAPLWPAALPTAAQPDDPPGWTACRIEVMPTPPSTLDVVHHDLLQLYGWTAFFLVVSLGLWRRMFRPRVWLLLLAAAGVTALLVREIYIPLSSSVFLAVLFVLLVRWLAPYRWWISRPLPPPAVDLPTTVVQPAAVAGLLLAATVLWGPSQARAAEAVPAATPLTSPTNAPPTAASPAGAASPSPIYDVFIPSDDAHRAADDVFYVPDALYDELSRRAEATQRPAWLLRRVDYRGSLAWQTTPERLQFNELRAQLTIDVVTPPARVRLPWPAEALAAGAESILLDGRPLPATLESGQPVVEVAEPGTHHVSIALRPAVRTAAGQVSLELALPRVASSRLELLVPPGAPPVQVAGGHDAPRPDGEGSLLTAELGPASRLLVSWPDSPRSAARPVVDAEELLWLRVAPGRVMLDARIKLHVLSGHVHEVLLAADPRLRLVPPAADSPTAARASVLPGQPSTVRLEPAHPATEQAVLDASFQLAGGSGVGRVRLPALDVLDVNLTRRALAFSVDPSLSYEEAGRRRDEAFRVSDFLADWGSSPALPQAALLLPAGEPPAWSLAVRPRPPATLVEQVLAVGFAQGVADVQLDAQLTTTGGYAFQHRLRVPPGLQIEQAALLVDGADCVDRWACDRDGTLTLFLSRPVSGRQNFVLRGRLPIPLRGTIPLPLVAWQQAQLSSAAVEIYRRPDTTVQLDHRSGLIDEEPPSAASRSDLGRLVRRLSVDPRQTAAATAVVGVNQPIVDARLITRLIDADQTWSAQLDLRLQTRGGVLDLVRIQVPAGWNGPYRVEPPAEFHLVKPPGEPRYLVVEPPQPVTRLWRLTITSPLAPATGSSLRVPDIQLRDDVASLKRFLVLPAQREKETLAWDRQGLSPVAVTADLAGPVTAPLAFAVRADAFRAVLHLRQQSPHPQVLLADVAVAWKDDGSYRGRALFDLDPGGATSAVVRLPRGCKLARVTVAGVNVNPEPKDDLWRVPLVLGQLPQPVEVLFLDALSAGNRPSRRFFQSPALADVTIQQTLWRVVGPGRFRAQPDAAACNALRAHVVRTKMLAAALDMDLAARAADADELLSWHRLWNRRLTLARTALAQEIAQVGLGEGKDTLAAAQSELQNADRRLAQVQGWLAARGAAMAVTAEPGGEGDLLDLWENAVERPPSIARTLSDTWTGAAAVDYADADATRGAALLRVGLLLGLIGVAMIGVSRGLWAALGERFPALAALGLGLAWWFWLSPPVLGMFVVAATLAALWLRQRQPNGPPDPADNPHPRSSYPNGKGPG